MEKIEQDIENIIDDSNKINCNPIIALFNHTLQCIKDCFFFFLKK
jgi:hypothetical protein